MTSLGAAVGVNLALDRLCIASLFFVDSTVSCNVLGSLLVSLPSPSATSDEASRIRKMYRCANYVALCTIRNLIICD